MLIAMRNALMAGKRLPYDAEVEYLESDGSAYINTGINGGSQIATDSYWARGISGANGIFGSRVANLVDQLCALFYTDSAASPGAVEYRFGAQLIQVAGIYSGKTHLVTDGATIICNGVVASGTSVTFANSYPISLFGINTRGTTFASNGARVYLFKIYDGGVLVRDFIPVRKGTVGYLYDRVSGELFGNAGTGAFICGPDKKK